MKKSIALVLTGSMLLPGFAGCQGSSTPDDTSDTTTDTSVAETTAPIPESKSIILDMTDSEVARLISVTGDPSPKSTAEGLHITGHSDQFYLTYVPQEEINLEEYPYVKIEYKINSSPSNYAQFYYYTDKTVTDTVAYPYVAFDFKGEIGEWSTMTFDFSTMTRIYLMKDQSGSKWEGKLDKFALYPLRMFSKDPATTRDMVIKYIGFFSDKESMEAFDSSSLKGETIEVERDELVVSDKLGADRIHIGAFFPYTSDVDEDEVKAMAEAGVDIAFVQLAGINLHAQANILDWHAKYGIMAWMQDNAIPAGEGGHKQHKFYAPAGKEYIESNYADHPAFYGNIFSDEPGVAHYDIIAEYVDRYNKDFPGKVPFVNLLPLYASSAQLTYGQTAQKIDFYDGDMANFDSYVRDYAAKIDTPYISTDIYPLQWDKDNNRKKVYGSYVRSIEAVANVCRETGREFWCYLQSFDSRSRPTFGKPDEIGFRWQAYSLLSFGAKNLFYYVWHAPLNSDYFETPIGPNGEQTENWYAAKTVNNEIIAISDAYLQYENIGAFTHNEEGKSYLKMESPLDGFEPIKEIKCDDALLIGCFDKKEGDGSAITLVNMSELYLEKTISVSLKLDGKTITSYAGGKPTVLTPDADGYCTIELTCGNGVFITIE